MQITVKEIKVLKTGENKFGAWKLVLVTTEDTEYTTLAKEADTIKPGSIVNITDMDKDDKDRENFKYVRQVSDKQDRASAIVLHPKLICVHGWAATKYAAGWHREKSPLQSVIFNHTHRMQSDTLTYPTSDAPTTAMSAGCLCNRVPMYGITGSPTGWTHGFWVAYVGADSFTIYSVIINRGRAILPCGREVKIV